MSGWKEYIAQAKESMSLRLGYFPSSRTEALFKTEKGQILIQSEAMRQYIDSVADAEPQCEISNVTDILRYKAQATDTLDLISRELQFYEIELPPSIKGELDSLLQIADSWIALFVSKWLNVPIDVEPQTQ